MSGYSYRLALRHLVLGLRRPRQATREAVEAGIGEIQRITLVFVIASLVTIVGAEPRAVLLKYVATTETRWVIPLILFLIAGLPLATAAYYVIGSTLVAVLFTLLRVPEWTFSGIRSAWAMATWIMTLPTLAYLLAASYLPSALTSENDYNPITLTVACVAEFYFAFCLTGISGVTLLQAFVTAVVAGLGLIVLTDFFFERVDALFISL